MGSPSAPAVRSHVNLGTQLVRSVEEFDARVGPPGGPLRDDFRTALLWDFGFIPAYWAVYAVSAALVALHPLRAAPWLGAAAGLLGTLAAVFDVQENAHTLQLLRTDGPTAGRIVGRMRSASLTKWTCAFAATGVLSAAYFERGGWFCLLAGGYAVGAGIGAVAVLLSLLPAGPRWVDNVLLAGFAVTGGALLAGVLVGAAYV